MTQPIEQEKAPNQRSKLIILGVVAALALGCYFLLADRLSLAYLAEQESSLRAFQQEHPYLVYVIAFCVYVLVTGLSIPGATALTLLYAWFFGFTPALVLVSFASTTGATLAFLLSRYLVRDAIQSRFGDRLTTFNEALDREGAFYLFTLRLIPAVPFFVINVVMGLTRIRVATYWWVSQLGMLAGTCVYVYAGSSIPELSQLADPSQLRSADLSDTTQVVDALSAHSSHPVGQHIRSIVAPEDRQWIDATSRSAEKLSRERTERLVSIMNTALKSPGLSLLPTWHEFVQDREDRTESQNRKARAGLTELNRKLLVQSFPEQIHSPQPIISPRLLIAFCLLGLFPIVAKRLITRIKRRSETT